MESCSGLLTDLYELTMAAGYVENGLDARASFELFVRHLPERRSYLVAAGLEQSLEFLENVRFRSDEIAYLRAHPAFAHVSDRFFDYLSGFRFTGDVWAMPEGTVFFPGEPVVRVTAPIAEAQIVETHLLATLNYQTLVASKAARVVTAAAGRHVVEFGTRRAHGMEAGVLAARAAYLGGCQGTSNVAAGHRFGIPTFGTQAHSWVMAHEKEADAFARFLDIFPEHATLLVDTYDVRSAIETIIRAGRRPRAIRLDSGDLAADSRWARQRLDRAGWSDVTIFASGDLDEYRIAELLAAGAAIDGFGVGTALATSADAPSLGVVYKLVEIERRNEVRPAAKFSAAKATYPGRKQVFRFTGDDGKYSHDLIVLEEEPSSPELRGGTPLLELVLRGGRRIAPPPSMEELRRRCRDALARLPARYLQLEPDHSYPVRISPRLEKLLDDLRRSQRRANSSAAR